MTDTTREGVDQTLYDMKYEVVNGEMDRRLAERIGKQMRALFARAEAAEANRDEWKQAATSRHPNPTDFRYWEGRYRDEKAEVDALQAKLVLAVEAMAGFASWDHCWPGNVNLEAECRKIRATLVQLTADTPNGADEDNRRAEMEEDQHQEEMRRMEEREMEDHFRRHPHG